MKRTLLLLNLFRLVSILGVRKVGRHSWHRWGELLLELCLIVDEISHLGVVQPQDVLIIPRVNLLEVMIPLGGIDVCEYPVEVHGGSEPFLYSELYCEQCSFGVHTWLIAEGECQEGLGPCPVREPTCEAWEVGRTRSLWIPTLFPLPGCWVLGRSEHGTSTRGV